MNSTQHLLSFLNKLKNNEPFSIIRQSYEEYYIMKNGSNNESLRQDLLNITSYNEIKNLYIGIPCKGCNEYIYNYFLDSLSLKCNQNLTYYNLFNNENFTEFLSHIKNTPFYYIGAEEKLNDFPVIDNFLISSDHLLSKWGNLKDIFTRALITWIGIIKSQNKQNNLLFLVSSGPIGKILIPLLFKLYPNYTFIDISKVNLYTSPSNIVCDFFNEYGNGYNEHYEHNLNTNNMDCSLYSLITDNDLRVFKGGWSYTFTEMSDLFRSLKYNGNRKKFSVLEFGGGESSIPLYDLLSRFYDVEYDIYESNNDYSINDKRINTTLYDIKDIENIDIHKKKYDLILIDGPNGSSRFIWYSKIRKCIKEDTIILIDDFVVYTISETELDRIFDYNILSRSDVPLVPYGEHSWRIINNIKLKEIDGQEDITAVLHNYNSQQLDRVRNQTVKPKQIIIWNSNSSNIIPHEVINDPSITIINSNNIGGVWAKFSAALLANTPYICVFDKDIIPGKKWFENCLQTIKKVNGLLGTTGLVYKKENGYQTYSPKTGSESMNETIQIVDSIINSWFFKKEWIHLLWSYIPNYNLLTESGVNVAFSWVLQQKGLNTYVPPHPKNDQEMSGCISNINIDTSNGISNFPNDDYALDHFMNRGFKRLKDFSNFCSEYDNFKYYHNDPVFHTSITNGTCEPYSGSYDIINKYIKLFPHKNRTFIDIGSHIGTTIMPFLKLYNNCLGYEPHPENYKFLCKNICDNNMSNRVILRNSCIGDKTTFGRMIYHDGHNSGCYYFMDIKDDLDNNVNNTYQVNCIRLDDDDNVSSRNDIDFIKIDTEGFELNVLKGAEQTIRRNKPLIEVEINGLSETHYGLKSENIFEYLYSLGAILFDSNSNSSYFYFPNDTLCIEPKNIFCFWTGSNQLTENRKESLKTIENYTLVTEENLDTYILKSHPLHESYKYLSETHKADYLRTYFMHFYGGGYTDIKRQTGSWSNSFDKLLENKNMYALGYTEIGPNGVSATEDNFYKPYWKELIGNGCYIFRPNTSFTKKWYENMLSILDKNLDLLKENPARHPRDCIEHFGWTSYPIKWAQILGDVFHPICYEYKDKLLHGLPIPLFYDYL